MKQLNFSLGILALLCALIPAKAGAHSTALRYAEFIQWPLVEQAAYVEDLRQWSLTVEKTARDEKGKTARSSQPAFFWSLLLGSHSAWSLSQGDTCIFAGYISKYNESIKQCDKPSNLSSTNLCPGQILCNPLLYGYGKPNAEGKFSGICTSNTQSPTAACDAQYMALPNYSAATVAKQISQNPSLSKTFDTYASDVDDYCASNSAKKSQKGICKTVETRVARQRSLRPEGVSSTPITNKEETPLPPAKPSLPTKEENDPNLAQAAKTESPTAFQGSADTFNCNLMEKVCTEAVSNCKKAFSKVTNQKALTYTMQYMLANHVNNGGLRDASCALASSSVSHGVMPPDQVKKGIQSGRFVLNDMDSDIGGKARGYYVDLCNGAFKEIKTNKGTGTTAKGNGFTDRNGLNTTLAGSFLTDSNSYAFTPYVCDKRGPTSAARSKCASYRSYIGRFGNSSGLKLIGLNSSNNSSEFEKPLHITPYRTSIGCPSINAEDGDIIAKLTAGGKTSLLINYHEGAMQNPNGGSCQNGNGERSTNKPSVSKKGNK